ncbi:MULTISPECIES: bifunctional DNA-formamidopyrimidine glycosylase/DNA-(apurinic or apyrimidinic site) lyase [unclassified Agrococcus]|uniref:bifunctional DNA-formamidopyrimidine glycosylase/DNA-(apurinic or apyrimidinic site) lyase n=1 Tax=unclassified Agrococcus TaxID=2615065 RepID=UPI00361AAF4A
MPELPEVEVVRLGLAPAVDGAVVAGVEVLDARSVARHDAGPVDFEATLLGRTMLAPQRRGKFLWVPLDDERAVSIHLGMSGQVLLREPGSPLERHTRVRLLLEHPLHGQLAVHFADQRIFGSMSVRALVDGVPDHAAHIALDPLHADFDADAVVARLRRRRQGVKAALLDQTLVSGIGNIYADEALWRARLHYLTPAERLTRARGRELLAEVQGVLERALTEGGTSFDAQYVNVNGESGYFSRSLRAYGQAGRPCARCGTTMVRESWANRSSYRCPRCQRRPRGLA